MSLIPLALRILTVKALRGQTYAEERVFDSQLDPIDETIGEGRSPVLVVSTDEEETKHEEGKDVLGANRVVCLILDAAVASKVKTGEGASQIEIPHTDGGMEAVLSVMGRQLFRALLTDATPWSDLWRRCVLNVDSVVARRGGASEQGVRFASRQYVFSCRTLAEPYFGDPVSGFWADLLALMEDDDDLAPLATVLRKEIETPTGLPEWAKFAAALGVSGDTVSRIGVGGIPVFGKPGDPIPALSGVFISGREYAPADVEEATT
jgi:hypothetical protein